MNQFYHRLWDKSHWDCPTEPHDSGPEAHPDPKTLRSLIHPILMPLCCCGGPSGPSKPSVRRTPAPDGAVYDRHHLPLGALLHGAQRLQSLKCTGSGIRVAVIDSGVDKDHPGFDGKVVKQEWYRTGRPLSEDDHGTHVAGTIHFMAPDAEIFDYRVFGARGVSVNEAIRRAIYQAVEDKCHLINMSLGGPLPDPRTRAAVEYATERGVLCVCAAGNSGDGNPLTNEESYPAQYPQSISVAAVSKENGLPVAPFSNSNVEVDYSGIGVDVISFKPDGGYQTMSGTSMACPHVCGYLAAVLSKSTTDARQKLADASIDIGLPGRDNSTGLGFVTALKRDELVALFGKMGVQVAAPKSLQANVY